jgi:hypothetical protein
MAVKVMEVSSESGSRASERDEKVSVLEAAGSDSPSSSMAVSIAGISTACSKDALVTSAKAVREALSTE